MTRAQKKLANSDTPTRGSGSGLGKDWIDQEVAPCKFRDVRLDKRFRTLVEQLAEGVGESIPWACEDWASTKAAYRFLSNEGVGDGQILAGHFQSTRKRVAAEDGLILVLHDTTEFSFRREDAEAIGIVGKASDRKDEHGDPIYFTTCGIFMHSSLVVTRQGLPLGIAAVKFWSRKEFKGYKQRRKAHNRPIEEKESIRWLENVQAATKCLGQPKRCLHIGDQESDIFELFGAARQLGAHFLVRTRADRLADGGPQTMAETIGQAGPQGLYRISVRDKRGGEWSEVELEVRYLRVRIQASKAKKSCYPAMVVTVIEARERDTPADRDPINWKLITDLPVNSLDEAIEKVQWYALRWKIEVFHKILKSGCKAEESRLRTSARMANLLAIFCLLSWRIFWLTMVNRCDPNLPPGLVFTALEIQILDKRVKDKPHTNAQHRPLSLYLTKLAQLGGYLARNNDPPPGNTVIWRGLRRLNDIEFGVRIARQLVGNC